MTSPTFEEMQRGELDWWIAFLRRPHSLARLFAIYGYRYLPWFFEDFDRLGNVIDFGSGPVSAAWIADLAPSVVDCVDPLFKAYREAGLIYGQALEAVPFGLPVSVYDTALLLNVLDHCEAPAALIGDAFARLRPGGKALVWTHVENGPDALHRRLTWAQVGDAIMAAGFRIDAWWIHDKRGPRVYIARAVKP